MATTATRDQVMVTTIDNQYNPFTQYEEWFALDATLGYHTPALLARYVFSSDELSDEDQSTAILDGIEQLIRDNPLGVHKKVTPESYSSES